MCRVDDEEEKLKRLLFSFLLLFTQSVRVVVLVYPIKAGDGKVWYEVAKKERRELFYFD